MGIPVPDSAGALAQFSVDSPHPPASVYTLPPSGLASVTNSRSFAEVTVPESPLTVKRR